MAGMYEGISGVARKVKSGFIGVSSVARKIKNGYIGVASVARKFLNSELIMYDNGTFADGFALDKTYNNGSGKNHRLCFDYSFI